MSYNKETGMYEGYIYCITNTVNGYMQPVDMYDLENNYIATYDNMISISEDYNPSLILRCCQGKIKKAHNHIWKFNNNAIKSA